MPPRPSDQRVNGGRDAMWKAMRGFKTGFTTYDIAHVTGCEITAIKMYFQALQKAGFIDVVDKKHRFKHVKAGAKKLNVYRLLRDSADAPRLRRDGSEVTRGIANDHMWRTMKMLPVFSCAELAAFASTDEVTVKLSTARAYVKHLYAAGYLTRPIRGVPGRPGKYRLLPSRNTGPVPPRIMRDKHVWDENRKSIMQREVAA